MRIGRLYFDNILLARQEPLGFFFLLQIRAFIIYCETHKTVNTRNIYEMLLFCEKLANKERDN